MKASQIRSRYLDYFSKRGHAVIPAAPIIPPDDPTTLFTSSGMQQLVPYLKGESHPMGKRLVDSQPSFRAEDIEEVGDNRHTTMFEMLGNWSLGDYFKKEQLPWIWEFFTKELNLSPDKLHVTLFEGDKVVPKDEESYQIWRKLGVPDERIHYYPASKNWWSRSGEPDNMPVGEIGGPTSEVFFEYENVAHDSAYDKTCHPNCDCGKYLEIGNSVFMEYEMTKHGLKKLPAQNVDFGGGLERLTAAVQDTPDVFATDMFSPIIRTIEEATGQDYQGDNQFPMRVIADHLRGAVFMGAQGVTPSNKLQGYIMRRLLRRAAVKSRALGGDVKEIFLKSIPTIIQEYSAAKFIDSDSAPKVQQVISQELDKFNRALTRGERELTKASQVDEQLAFDLYQSLGFPFEITAELVAKQGITLNESKFNTLLQAHQDASRTASSGMFKGGLADHSETTTKYHTATHLLHQALADVLGEDINQAGSNITAKRLRFDYTYSGKPSEQQLKQIEQIVNDKIEADLPVTKTTEEKTQALASGVRAFFPEKYPTKVTVYRVGDYSAELCGGPHVTHTGEIGPLKITKDENLGSGKRRIYAQLAA